MLPRLQKKPLTLPRNWFPPSSKTKRISRTKIPLMLMTKVKRKRRLVHLPVMILLRTKKAMSKILPALAMSKKEPKRYDYAGATKEQLRKVMRRDAADIRSVSKMLTYPFGPGSAGNVYELMMKVDQVTPAYRNARFEGKLMEWLSRLVLHVCMAVKTPHAAPFVYRLLLLLHRLREIRSNVRLWTALAQEAHWELKHKVEDFVHLHHKFLPDRETLLAKAAMVDDASGLCNLNVAAEVDYTNNLLRHVCQIALLAGDIHLHSLIPTPSPVQKSSGCFRSSVPFVQQ